MRSTPAAGEPSSPLPIALVVEDEGEVRRFLRESLVLEGYRVMEAGEGRRALEIAVEYLPGIVLLDLGLPDMDGMEVLRRLREWSAIPVVVISARGREAQKVEALDAGADDFLTKPFGVKELRARMRVALRNFARVRCPRNGSIFRSGDLEVDLAARRVRVRGSAVHLTPTEYRLLGALLQDAGKVLTQRQLLRDVWGPEGVARPHDLRVHMANLRHKIEEDPARPRLLLTEAGIGYRMAEDVPQAPGS